MAVDFEKLIVDIPDYPTPGVVFKDITPVLGDAQALAEVVDAIAGRFADCGVTKIAAAEARGFMLGAAIAYKVGVGFVPVRKPGKLPREVYSQEFVLEYGTDSLEIHQDAFDEGDVVLLVDDLVATGGTVVAMVELVERAGARVAGMGFFMELAFLHPREAIADRTDADVFSVYAVG